MMMSAQAEMLNIALKKGTSSRGNRRIEFEGTYHELPSFETRSGMVVEMTGIVTCWYYSSKIYCIDFDNKRATDFGMCGYSISTTGNISAWMSAFNALLLPSPCANGFSISSEAIWGSRSWSSTHDDNDDPGSDRPYSVMRERFMSRAPWCYVDRNRVRWFAWDLFDPDLAGEFHHSNSVLHTDQNWRYYTFDWDAEGRWTKRFIDADAEHRFMARLKKRNPRGNIP